MQKGKTIMSIDIIIPIYNAYEDLQICLESIYRNTNLQHNRLILINDNSPDERIKPFLDEQVRENVIVIHNEENRGFSNNINLGMAQSKENDVILLNSDTIVTKNWVEKIVECAYSDSMIGTVTPLSNNATLCSVPNFCEENELPKGMSVDQVADIVENCSLKKYPRITVAHGFCMMVKREVIDCIGKFDAETFGRGYGEENDFCNRAEQMGYLHVMCDNTYIYHSGTKSFISKEKEEYIRKHDKILHERYPQQMQNNAVHCRDNPNGWVGKNIAYHLDIWNGKKNVLYLLQSDFKEGADDNVGGTQLHVKHLTMGLRNDMNVFVAARDKTYLQVTAYVGEKEHTFRFYIGEAGSFPVLHDRTLAGIFHQILEGFRIDLVHVHHTATTSLDIFYEANKLNIPIIYTAHDFYYVCPSVKMLDGKGKVCIEQKQHDCAACLRDKLGLYEKNAYMDMWRRKHGEVLEMCRQIIVPSESTKEILSKYYQEIAPKIQVIEHGLDKPELLDIHEEKIIYTDQLVWRIDQVNTNKRCPSIIGVAYFEGEQDVQRRSVLKVTDCQGKCIYLPTNFEKNLDLLERENKFYAYLPNGILADGDLKFELILFKGGVAYKKEKQIEIVKNVTFDGKANFRVAFIGGINEEKGGKVVTEVIKQGPADVEWYVMGGIGYEELYHLKKDNLVKTGFYYQDDLHTFLTYHKIDVICLLSKWPETFSYTLSEAILSNIPVIATDIGALGQRIRKYEYGKVVNAEEANGIEEVVSTIKQWKEDSNAYQTVLNKVKNFQHKNVEYMVSAYVNLYDGLTSTEKEYKVSERSIQEKIYEAYMLGMNYYEGQTALMSRVDELQRQMNIINNSVTFKVVRKLTSLEIPFKKQIKRLLTKH